MDNIYMAGFFDGEGYIGIQKRQRGKYTEYYLVISIGQNDGKQIDWVQKNFGGFVHRVKRDASFFWIARDLVAYKILKRIVPHLKYKKPQAEIALKFYEEREERKRRISKEEMDRRESLLLELKRLKRIFTDSSYIPKMGVGSTTKRVNSES